jgi:hypothetical protein
VKYLGVLSCGITESNRPIHDLTAETFPPSLVFVISIPHYITLLTDERAVLIAEVIVALCLLGLVSWRMHHFRRILFSQSDPANGGETVIG